MNKPLRRALVLCLLSMLSVGASAQTNTQLADICPALAKVTKIAATQAKGRAGHDLFETTIFKALMSSTKNEARKSLYTETFSSAQAALQESGGNAERASAAAESTCMKA